ncbi:hypothetical protein Lal_00012165 [Lupinus albus]|uniref:Putative BURP domain-containing protein n=1 Tax=Lupinus albus TaxID=3870 RepID=A0A6A5MHL6_LUPAL|nr:putative BURP domain-containing protein [Lupinus albus]KAF1871948.1 hypothetical protein Lal_00012165 [Lupinus albus]
MINKNILLNHTSTLFLFILFSTLTVSFARHLAGDKNPFTPKASVIRYWDTHISNNLPKPSFLFSKASPLSAVDTATFAKLAATNTLSTRLPEFCSAAHLLCLPEVLPNLEKHANDVKFSGYNNDDHNFTNYGTNRASGVDSFKNYSVGLFSNPVSDFRQYSRNSAGHKEKFTTYGIDGNIVDQSFHTYGTSSAGGSGEFKEYTAISNLPDLRFSTYSVGGVGREQSFTGYSEDGNSGKQSFTSYGKNGLGANNKFKSYGTSSNVVKSAFSNYGEKGTSPNDTFTSYGVQMNGPNQTFSNYGDGSTFAAESFANYRDQSNVGDDSFQSYVKDSKGGAQVDFNNYGKAFNGGSDTFKGYAKGADLGHKVRFKGYGDDNKFKDYTKDGVTFSSYKKSTTSTTHSINANTISDSLIKKWVPPGKFFREKMLKQGIVMPMPDISDKSPKRSFLPRPILSKIPFTSSKISELKEIFKVSDNSSMEKMIMDSLGDCERAPSMGETKKCVGSVEDMIDFATSVLGHNVAARTTENVNGSKTDVMVGKVKAIDGGKVTESVSCHQSLFPYLLYYCHSVPKVRVYEADLLDPTLKTKINHGVAICHLDTKAWSPTHGAFLALGSGPGRIEVCHWIFENDLTWTIAN